MKMHGWTVTYGFGQDGEKDNYIENPLSFYDFSLKKFPRDCIHEETEKSIVFLDGYVYNKASFVSEGEDWKQGFCESMEKSLPKCLTTLRGGFCGFVYDKQSRKVSGFTDQVANKAIYYYQNDDKWMLGTHLDDMVRRLQDNHCSYTLSETAVQFMLSYGFMIDDSTFIQEIKRILPGQYVTISNGSVETGTYYRIPCQEVDMTEEEAIALIDDRFRQAVAREFEKDKEYGYRHLVDLSGGLDSRMTSWVAHSLGYTEQLNMTYCRAGYLDEKIARKIALYLQHEYVFKMLDDICWMKDIDTITSQNNGAALFLGITGGSRLLELIDTELFGIEHTGMIGDAILSTFYKDKSFSHGKPCFGYNRYSDRLPYTFDESILDAYPNQEQFAVYTRGILGAQSSYITRQHFVETASPFMDVDFLEAVFTVPFAYRNNHHIYLRWLQEKYPEATRFGWEKWNGVKPRTDQIWKRRCITTKRLLIKFLLRISGKKNHDNMTPVDYWYEKDASVRKYYDDYYEQNIKAGVLPEALRNDIQTMYCEGNVFEKGMALTVLAEVKKYFRG